MQPCDPASVQSPATRYKGLKPETSSIVEMFRKNAAHRPFSEVTVLERDIAIPPRDGTFTRGDVDRSADPEEKVPALVA